MTVLQLIETVVPDIEKYMPTWHLTHEYILLYQPRIDYTLGHMGPQEDYKADNC